jgi:hypothetical protein
MIMADEIVAKELAHDTSGPTIARLAAQRTKFRAAAAKLTTERDAARKEVAQLKLDMIEAGKTGDAATELAALKAKVRLDKHRAKFNELAKAEGAHDKGLDDLWEKSGYASPGDVPDEAMIKAAIAKQKVDRDYLFDEAPEEPKPGFVDGPPEPEKEAARPGPGRGQGGTKRATGGQFQATDAQLRDPNWCFANQAKLNASAKEVAEMGISAVTEKFAIV